MLNEDLRPTFIGGLTIGMDTIKNPDLSTQPGGDTDLPADFSYIVLTEAEINIIVKRIARAVSSDFAGRKLLCVCVLKGAFIFAADLAKRIAIPAEIDFIRISSYGNSSESTGEITVLYDISRKSLAGYDVLIVEDIIDTGYTLKFLKKHFLSKGAEKVSVCALLDKFERRKTDVVPEYTGEKIPDEFVVGYGLDYAERYRHLPYIAVLKPSVYMK